MLRDCIELARVSFHRAPLKDSHNHQEKSEKGKQLSAYVAKRDTRFARGLVIGAFFGPGLWFGGKLIDNNRTILGGFIIGLGLVFAGASMLLLSLTVYSWSCGWWL